jgi:hypothetical protein
MFLLWVHFLSSAIIYNKLKQIFEEASTTLQMSDTPALHQSLMLFDYLTINLESFIIDAKLLPAIRAAAKHGTLMVNKYTTLCQESLLPHLAISNFVD